MKSQITDRPVNSVISSAHSPPLTHTLTPIQTGILRAISYADVFDYPLTLGEVHRYLVGVPATRGQTRSALDGRYLPSNTVERHDEFYTLPGRSGLVETRHRRAEAAAGMWVRARRYGRLIARLPFVRMVAVTGALAVNNCEPGDDIDYLVVTAPGRLWLCRAFVILLVKIAAWRGDVICPNYFLSEEALALPERDLFTAHELVQMVPLAGQAIYQQMMRLNSWTEAFLPNAGSDGYSETSSDRHPIKILLETILSTPPAGWLERWEMTRKIARFNRQVAGLRHASDTHYPLSELIFSATQCKGHFSRHGEQTLKAYSTYLQQLEELPLIGKM